MLTYLVRFKKTLAMNLFVAPPATDVAMLRFDRMLTLEADRAFNRRMKEREDHARSKTR